MDPNCVAAKVTGSGEMCQGRKEESPDLELTCSRKLYGKAHNCAMSGSGEYGGK